MDSLANKLPVGTFSHQLKMNEIAGEMLIILKDAPVNGRTRQVWQIFQHRHAGIGKESATLVASYPLTVRIHYYWEDTICLRKKEPLF